MAKTVIGLLENTGEAEKTVEELVRNGLDRRQIGIISPEIGREAAAALAGSSKGMVLGGLGGMLLGAVALAIPGIGPVIAAGPALPMLGGVAGAIAGGIIGGLTSKGIPEADAHFYAEGMRRGGTMIIVRAKSDEQAKLSSDILKRHGAVDVQDRSNQWARVGWNRRFIEGEPAPAGAGSSVTPAPASTSTAGPSGKAQQAASGDDRERAVAAAPPGEEPARAQPVRGTAGPDQPSADEPAVELSAVRVYSFEIAVPEDTQAANQSAYSGPERRVRSTPHNHEERRKAA